MQNNSAREDLLDLGAVSVETKGVMSGFNDHEGGLQPLAGLADD